MGLIPSPLNPACCGLCAQGEALPGNTILGIFEAPCSSVKPCRGVVLLAGRADLWPGFAGREAGGQGAGAGKKGEAVGDGEGLWGP